ncbi:MAG: hypothetical protein ABSE73_21355 [Planctomycetota bacterium]
MLAQLWTAGDINAAISRRVPWHTVIQLLYLDGLARRMTEADSRATISQRRQLVRSYPRDRAGVKVWRARLATIKAACLRRLDLPAQAKQISEARQAVDFRLSSALERMRAIMPVLPAKYRKQVARLAKELESLRTEIESVNVAAAEELRGKKKALAG